MALLCVVVTIAEADAQSSARLNGQSLVVFTDLASAQDALGAHDLFTDTMSAFDRMSRMQVATDPGIDAYLTFVRASAMQWTPEETQRLTTLISALAEQCQPYVLPLPQEVLLIKSSGEEEGGAPYTRGSAIILPAPFLQADDARIQNVLAHELFHVMSRHSADFRWSTYEIVGFNRCNNDIAYPPTLAPRKITNPDGYNFDFTIVVEYDDEKINVVPVIVSTSETYDVDAGGGFFSYLHFALMVVDNADGNWVARIREGDAVLLEPDDVDGYFEQIGRNTRYIIHPDEIMADNFALLLRAPDEVATPRITDALAEVLRNAD